MPFLRLAIVVAAALSAVALSAAEKTEHFDTDPHWDAHNNRAASPPPRQIRQDFGWSPTSHAGGAPGEIGGYIMPAAEAAYYAKPIPTRTFNDPLSASGTFTCSKTGFHILVGFFNTNTINEWRTPSTIALRIQGRKDVFFAYAEYCTSRWRAGGDDPGGFSTVRDPVSGRLGLKGFPSGSSVVHHWSLRYDPNGNDGKGSLTVKLDDETSVCRFTTGHKADGATFNHFGVINVMKQFDNGGEVWLDDLTINGEKESFDHDPGWDAFHNRRTYMTDIVRPRFDFGYTPTHYAGGVAAGELGGLIFRGDGRYTNMMAYYGARLAELTLAKPLKASGKVALRRAVTDSDTPFGFFHSEHSLDSGNSDKISLPPDFLGVTIGGPSREGFMFCPAFRLHGTELKIADHGPYLYPDGRSHKWTFQYSPATGDQPATIAVTLDNERATLSIPPKLNPTAHFNRFGLISTHTDGNGQHLYFDDLSFTATQEL